MAQIDQEGVEAILNLGDLVGYNASPNECLELLQGRNVWSLAGNHDLALLDPERAQHFNIIAYEALMWCRQQVRPEFLEFLQGLPLVREQPGSFLACHGTPANPDTYIAYHFQGKRVLKDLLRRPDLRVCFFGHTHRRALWYRDIRGKVALRPIAPATMLLIPGGTLSHQPRQRRASPGTATPKRPTPSSTTRSSPSNSNPPPMMCAGPNAASWPPGCRLIWRSAWPWGLRSEQ